MTSWTSWECRNSFRDILRDTAHIPPHEIMDATLVAQRRQQLAELRPAFAGGAGERGDAAGVAAGPGAHQRRGGRCAEFSIACHGLLEQQPYRLAFWAVSCEEIQLPEIFDINDLAGLRMENAEVFAATHGLIRRLLARGEVTGLRIDHCDGMFNPRQYLIRLQLLLCGGRIAVGKPAGADGAERNRSGSAGRDARMRLGGRAGASVRGSGEDSGSRGNCCRGSGRCGGLRDTTSCTRAIRFSFAKRMRSVSRGFTRS